jgi:hypothetical protein
MSELLSFEQSSDLITKANVDLIREELNAFVTESYESRKPDITRDAGVSQGLGVEYFNYFNAIPSHNGVTTNEPQKWVDIRAIKMSHTTFVSYESLPEFDKVEALTLPSCGEHGAHTMVYNLK